MLEQWGCLSAAHVPWLLVLFLVVADRSEGRAATVLGGDHGCSYDCDPHFLGSRLGSVALGPSCKMNPSPGSLENT